MKTAKDGMARRSGFHRKSIAFFQELQRESPHALFVSLAAISALTICAAMLTSCGSQPAKRPAKFLVRDFGALPGDEQSDGRAIRACIAAAMGAGKPAEVVFEAGEYRVEPAPVSSGELWSLPVKGAKELLLVGSGEGTTLVFTNPSAGGILFEDSSDVSVRHLRIDYDPLPYAFGTIVAVNEQNGTFDLELEAGSIAFDHPAFSKENAKAVWGMAVRPDPVHGTTRYGPDIIGGGGMISPVQGRCWRLESKLPPGTTAAQAGLVAGVRYVHMARTYGAGVCFRKSANVRAEGVTILASPGLAFLPLLCEGETAFVDCHIRVVPGRPLSTNADGIHARGLRGSILIERCSFEGMADDGINIHSSAILVQNIVSPSEIIALNHSYSVRPGDELVAMDPLTLAVKARTSVASSEPGPESTRIRFTEPVPGLKAHAFADEGSLHGNKVQSAFRDVDRIYNLSEAGSPFVIRNCKFLSFRGRGILASSTGGTIERNRFENNEGWAIYLGFGEQIWGEGPPPANIVIANNEFIGKGGIMPAIKVGATINWPAWPVRDSERGIQPLRNLTIRNNTFENLSAPAIRLGGVQGAIVANNTITGGVAAKILECAAVEVDNSAGVVISRLTVKDPGFASDLMLGSLMEPGERGVAFEPAGLRVKDQRPQ